MQYKVKAAMQKMNQHLVIEKLKEQVKRCYRKDGSSKSARKFDSTCINEMQNLVSSHMVSLLPIIYDLENGKLDYP